MCVSRLERVVGRDGPGAVKTVDADGATHRVSLLALEGPEPADGEWLVVHSGYAIDRVDEVEARADLDLNGRAGAPALAVADTPHPPPPATQARRREDR